MVPQRALFVSALSADKHKENCICFYKDCLFLQMIYCWLCVKLLPGNVISHLYKEPPQVDKQFVKTKLNERTGWVMWDYRGSQYPTTKKRKNIFLRAYCRESLTKSNIFRKSPLAVQTRIY